LSYFSIWYRLSCSCRLLFFAVHGPKIHSASLIHQTFCFRLLVSYTFFMILSFEPDSRSLAAIHQMMPKPLLHPTFCATSFFIILRRSCLDSTRSSHFSGLVSTDRDVSRFFFFHYFALYFDFFVPARQTANKRIWFANSKFKSAFLCELITFEGLLTSTLRHHSLSQHYQCGSI
jgi:hypothetical protein